MIKREGEEETKRGNDSVGGAGGDCLLKKGKGKRNKKKRRGRGGMVEN